MFFGNGEVGLTNQTSIIHKPKAVIVADKMAFERWRINKWKPINKPKFTNLRKVGLEADPPSRYKG